MKQSQPPRSTPCAGDPAAGRLRLEAFLPYRLSVLASRLSRALAATYQRQFDMSIPEWRVMAVLGRFAPLSASEVSLHTSMDRVKVSRAIARLEARALVVRAAHPADQRRLRLSLSRAGLAVHEEIAALALGFEAALLGGLTDTQRQALEDSIDALEERLRAFGGPGLAGVVLD